MVSGGTPASERATFWAKRPAEFTTVRQARSIGDSPPTRSTIRSSRASPPSTGLRNAIIAPASAASPS